MEKYISWLKANGATFDAIDWPVMTPETGRGAVATEDVFPNQSFVSIPSKLVIDPPLCQRAPDIGPFLSSHRVFMESHEVTIAVYLCHERLKGKNSFWEPYIDSLPKDTGLIYTWTPKELEELQDAALVEEAVRMGPEERRQIYDRVVADLKTAVGGFKQVTNERTLTFELFSWALETVCCRAFGRRIKYTSLVPLADNLNHSNVQTKYSYDGKVFRLFPSGKNVVKKGSEAFNSYGRRSNANLLVSYGFALDDNEWDELSVGLGLPESSPNLEKKRQIMPGPVVAKLKLNEIPHFLLIFFRINFATDVDLRAFSASSSSANYILCSYLNLKNERLALSGAIDELHDILASFPTTEDEDRQILTSPALPLRKVFAIRYRIGRKRVLKFNIELLEKLCEVVKLMDDELRREGKTENPETIDPSLKQRYEIAQNRLLDAMATNKAFDDVVALLASM